MVRCACNYLGLGESCLTNTKEYQIGNGIGNFGGQNRQSLVFSERGQLSQAILPVPCGTNVKRTNANRAIRIANATNAGSVRTNFCVLGGDMTVNER